MNDVGDILVGQDCGHWLHLHALIILCVFAAPSGTEQFELSLQVPWFHACQTRGLNALAANAVGAVTRKAEPVIDRLMGYCRPCGR